MRVKQYYRKTSNSPVEVMTFTAEHYREARTMVTPEFGMNEMTAIQLVNSWNRHSNGTFVYWV